LTGLDGGMEYPLTIEAYNKYGSAASSEILVYLAAQVPEQVERPIVTIYESYAFAQWNAPFQNYEEV
jgi:hypothetical protein